MPTRILIVDDDPVQLRLTSAAAEKGGFAPLTAEDGETAIAMLEADPGIGAVVLDLVMPDLDGMGVMDRMQRAGIHCPVIIQTARSSLETVTSCMRQGAVDFFVKPVAPERLIISLRNALKMGELESCVRQERSRREGRFRIEEVIAHSAPMRKVIDLGRKAARSNIPVLLEGESGTGKEIIARAIQGSSDRAGKPFITVNCGALPPDLVESTLFGHRKGAFTGATADHAGKFAEADGGTIFLDEIGELPADMQVKLLRVIQDGEIEPVGVSRPERVNVRLISATNRRLLNQTKAGHFREDLYYRLNVFPIYIPPLRERPEDIAPLAAHFMARLGAEAGRGMLGIGDAAMTLLREHDWPGNVRQLENAIYRALVLAENAYLLPADFPQINAARHGTELMRAELAADRDSPRPVHIDAAPAEPGRAPGSERFVSPTGGVRSLAEVERDLIAFALDHHGHRMTQVAKSLGIGRSTLYRKLKEYGLDETEGADAA